MAKMNKALDELRAQMSKALAASGSAPGMRGMLTRWVTAEGQGPTSLQTNFGIGSASASSAHPIRFEVFLREGTGFLPTTCRSAISHLLDELRKVGASGCVSLAL